VPVVQHQQLAGLLALKVLIQCSLPLRQSAAVLVGAAWAAAALAAAEDREEEADTPVVAREAQLRLDRAMLAAQDGTQIQVLMAVVAVVLVLLGWRVVQQVMVGSVQKALLTEPPLLELVEVVGPGKRVLQLVPR
jgi:hypothetical protein